MLAAAEMGVAIVGYEILGELGRGGMGVVYKARQIKADRLVALKMILSGGHASERDLNRFRTEAHAVARMQHANIVQVYEVGEQEGLPFFSLEYLEGGSLADKLDGTPWPARKAAELVETLARAMQAAHDKGIIHRDLKPANILLTADGTPKITDFGLAKRLDSAGQTQTGAIMGTPSYMAPEQAGGKGKEVGPAADVYALGAILYELLTGRPPFKAETPLDTVLQVVNEEPVPPIGLNPKVPRDLDTICLKCLRKDVGRRYPSSLTFAHDLCRFLKDEPILARPTPGWERLAKWTQRRPAVAALLAIVMTITLVSLGVVTALWREAETERDRAKEEWHRAEQATNHEIAQREAAQRFLSQLALDRGTQLCEQGEIDQGMLWLASALENLPESSERERQSIRTLLSGWRSQLHEIRALVLHGAPILHAAFSPDCKMIVTAGLDGKARLWDVATAKPLCEPLLHQAPVFRVRFSPDNKMLLTASGYGATWLGPDQKVDAQQGSAARLWDATTGEPLTSELRLAMDPAGPPGITFRPDGKSFITWSNTEVRIWDVNGQPVGRPLLHPGRVCAAVYSPNGKTLLTGTAGYEKNEKVVRLWDAVTGKPQSELPQPEPISALAFRPDGNVFVVGYFNGADTRNSGQLWDLASGQPIGDPFNKVATEAAAFSPDGKICVTTGMGFSEWPWACAQRWDASTGKAVGDMIRHGTPGWMPSGFSADGKRLLTASHGNALSGTIRGEIGLWESDNGQKTGVMIQHPGRLKGASLSPDGKDVLSWDESGVARLWDVARHTQTTVPIAQPVVQHEFSPDGKIMAVMQNSNTCFFLETATGKQIGESVRLKNDENASSFQFSPDGGVLLISSMARENWVSRLFEVPSGRMLAHLPIAKRSTAIFSWDGRVILTIEPASSGQLWDVATGKPIGSVFPTDPYMVAFLPGGKHLVTIAPSNIDNEPTSIRAVDINTGKLSDQALTVPGVPCVFSPDGTRLLTMDQDGTARLWNSQTGDLCWQVADSEFMHDKFSAKDTFTPDGRHLLLRIRDRGLQLLDARTGAAVGVPASDRFGFSIDGKTILAMSGQEESLRIWDVATGKMRGQLYSTKDGQEPEHCVISPDSQYILISSEKSGVRLWNTTTAKPVGPALSGQPSGQISRTGQFLLQGQNKSWLQQLPTELGGTTEQVVLWVQVNTDQELNSGGSIVPLEEATWRRRYERLQALGGPPQ
jgi:serine/threonine protein kinase/WD40 repeat protein